MLLHGPVLALSLAASSGAGPVEVTRAFYKALHAGDARSAGRFVVPEARPALAPYVRIARAHRDVEAAVARRFGEGEAARIGYGNKVQAEVKALLGARAQVVGDRALVRTSVGDMLATLLKVRGEWKLELDDALATPAGQERIAREAEAAEAAARLVADRIRAGKYPEAAPAVRDFQEAMAVRAGEPPPAAGAPQPAPAPVDGGADL